MDCSHHRRVQGIIHHAHIRPVVSQLSISDRDGVLGEIRRGLTIFRRDYVERGGGIGVVFTVQSS